MRTSTPPGANPAQRPPDGSPALALWAARILAAIGGAGLLAAVYLWFFAHLHVQGLFGALKAAALFQFFLVGGLVSAGLSALIRFLLWWAAPPRGERERSLDAWWPPVEPDPNAGSGDEPVHGETDE